MPPAAPSTPREASAQDAAAIMGTLQALREEIRSRLPRESPELQLRFAALDRQMRDLETAAQATGSAARALMRSLLHSFHDLRDALRSATEAQPSPRGG